MKQMASKGTQNKPRKKRRTRPEIDSDPVIYCLEGVWRDTSEDSEDQTSHDGTVRPLLEYLEQNDYWNFRHRDVATADELEWYIKNEWHNCLPGSILYITTHGFDSGISLSHDCDVYLTNALMRQQSEGSEVDLLSMLSKTDSTHCHIHFGGCEVMKESDVWIEHFLKETGAAVVSGFRQSIGWTGLELPGVLAELMMFSALSGVNYDHKNSFKSRLSRIKKKMNERFDSCDFYYKTR